MKILLVGSADTIFFTNYVTHIKKHIDVEVHVYSPYPTTNNYDNYPYDYVYFEKSIKYRSKVIQLFVNLFSFLIYKIKFLKFLKTHKNENYDIIHFHRIIPPWVVPPFSYKKYCKNTVGTFWGGEIEVEKIMFSHKIYLFFLRKFAKKCNYFINTFAKKSYTDNLPGIKEKAFNGSFGSSIIDEMKNLNYSREEAKKELGIPYNKISVLLGYSGKFLHRHCEIIDGIVSSPNFNMNRERIHVIVSMTRAYDEAYCNKIENKLQNAKIGYTILKGKYSTDKDVAILRHSTDIVFQLSDYDGLSASIKECVCAGSILISGKWLNYNTLKKEGFHFYEVNCFDDGIALFYNILNNFEIYSAKCHENRKIAINKYSWSSCIKPWAEAYKEISLNENI